MSQDFNKILAELKKRGNPKNVAGMARFGIASDKAFGVSHPELHEIAKPYRKQHELALELWASGYHEARLLAAVIDDPKQVTAKQMDAWVKDFNSWDICDDTTGNLFADAPYAFDKAFEWIRSEKEFIRRAGLAMMVWLTLHRKKEPDERFVEFFAPIERVAGDERNFVKKAVSWALRTLGKRSQYLNKQAVLSAKRVAKIDSKAARWVAADVLKEIQGEKVQARLAEKAKKAKKAKPVKKAKKK
jgi:3-methyladenine DNA glycosylase AlkD